MKKKMKNARCETGADCIGAHSNSATLEVTSHIHKRNRNITKKILIHFLNNSFLYLLFIINANNCLFVTIGAGLFNFFCIFCMYFVVDYSLI